MGVAYCELAFTVARSDQMGWQIQKQDCASGSNEFCQEWLEAATLELGVRSSGSAFFQKFSRVLKGRPCRSWQELVQVRVCTLDTVYCVPYALSLVQLFSVTNWNSHVLKYTVFRPTAQSVHQLDKLIYSCPHCPLMYIRCTCALVVFTLN